VTVLLPKPVMETGLPMTFTTLLTRASGVVAYLEDGYPVT
jgi:hypothetical protein